METKLFLMLGLVVVIFVVASCAPQAAPTDEEELFGESAVAGGAISYGCKDVVGKSCRESGSTVYFTSSAGGSYTYTDSCGNLAKDYSCANSITIRGCSAQCTAGEVCQSGICVTVPTILIEGQTSPRVEVIPSGTSVLIEANDVLVLEAPATANLGSVTVTMGVTAAGGAAVVVVGLERVEHYVYISNTRNSGIFTCPTGTTVAETIPTCPSVITYSYANCAAGTGGCSIVGSQYRVRSTGSSHGEGPVEICNGVDDDADSLIDEGCDDDNDGYCDSSMTFTPVSGTSTCDGGRNVFNSNCCWFAGDCADTDSSVFPSTGNEGARGEPLCRNRIDDDCDGIVNDGCPEDLCDDIDNDGDGIVDEGCDVDNDDYCRTGVYVTVTGPPYPLVCPKGGGDCQDDGGVWGATLNPGATENCFDDYDNNCNGAYNEGCTPYTCSDSDPDNDVALGGQATITAATGATLVSSDFCSDSTQINQTICVALSSTSNWNLAGRNVLSTCPSGTTCTDPDGPTGTTPAVCS